MGVSVREKKPGSGVWWLFVNHKGQHRSKQVGPKREAERLKKIIEGKLASGDLGVLQEKPVKKTVKEYSSIWLEGTVKTTLKKSTAEDYGFIVKNHVSKSPFYNHSVDQMTKGQVKRFLRSKLSAGFSVSTVTHIKNCLGGIFNEAIDDEEILTNPSHGIRLGNKKTDSRKPKIEPLEVEEVNRLLVAYKDRKPQLYPLAILLVATGMRIGEASALQWRDVDFEDRSILVRRNYVRGRIEESTKNGKDRRADTTEQLASCLRVVKKERAEVALRSGKGNIDKDWLFKATKDPSLPINYRCFRKDFFYPMLETAGIRRIRIHDLRHTFASIMIGAGCNLVYLRDQLGHSSIKVTADVYGHLLRGNKEKPVDALDGLLQPSAPYAHPETKKGASLSANSL